MGDAWHNLLRRQHFVSKWCGARRAAWAVVEVAEDAKVKAVLTGPGWASLPQTPQAAEYVARCAAVQCANGPIWLVGDCANVVRSRGAAECEARLATSDRRLYAGASRTSDREPTARHIRGEIKVRAHQALPRYITCLEHVYQLGNAAADIRAKEAVSRHPQPCQDPLSVRTMDETFEKYDRVRTVIAKVGACWPACTAEGELNRRRKAGRRPRDEVKADEGTHE